MLAGHYGVLEAHQPYRHYELADRGKRSFVHTWIIGVGSRQLRSLQYGLHAEAMAFRQLGA